jgi:outer membrane protein assembly factor BamB
MKTLILSIISNICSLGLNAQPKVVAQTPIFISSENRYSWQVSDVITSTEGYILVGQGKNAHKEHETTLIKTDKLGNSETILKLNQSRILAVCLTKNKSLCVLNTDKSISYLTNYEDIDRLKVNWKIELPKLKSASITTLQTGRIVLATDTENFVKIQIYGKSGEFIKDILFKKLVKNTSPCKIITLKNGTLALIGGSKIWGLADNGEVIWEFGTETNKSDWQQIKQLSNDEVIVMGTAKSDLFDATHDDIQVWAINEDGSQLAWNTSIGEEGKDDKPLDFIETKNGELLILAETDRQSQFIKLNAEHLPSLVYTAQDPSKSSKFLFSDSLDKWFTIGNAFDDNGRRVFLQHFSQKIEKTTKPNLNVLSIGINGTALRYAKADAERIDELFRTHREGAFGKIETQVYTTDAATKAGELAKTFELMSTQNIQEEDLVIVFISGNGTKAQDDYLLFGSDYDPAALRSTSLKLSQLIKDLDNLPCRKLLILDACYSGAATELNLPNNISILTASTANQVAFEDPKWQHGALTKVLIEALNTKKADSNADGYTTLNELFDYTKKKLPILTQTKRIQNPLLLHKGDDFVVFEK